MWFHSLFLREVGVALALFLALFVYSCVVTFIGKVCGLNDRRRREEIFESKPMREFRVRGWS